MTDNNIGNGSCLCGSVQFTASNVNDHVGAVIAACVENGVEDH